MTDIKLTANNLDYVIQELKTVDVNQEKRIKITPWKEKRGLSSNAQIHLWFGQIAKQQGYTAAYIKNACKVMFGIDILLSSETDTARCVVRTLERIDYWNMDWVNKIDVVSGLMVTSLFTTSEIKEFMEKMLYFWNDKGVDIGFRD